MEDRTFLGHYDESFDGRIEWCVAVYLWVGIMVEFGFEIAAGLPRNLSCDVDFEGDTISSTTSRFLTTKRSCSSAYECR